MRMVVPNAAPLGIGDDERGRDLCDKPCDLGRELAG